MLFQVKCNWDFSTTTSVSRHSPDKQPDEDEAPAEGEDGQPSAQPGDQSEAVEEHDPDLVAREDADSPKKGPKAKGLWRCCEIFK